MSKNNQNQYAANLRKLTFGQSTTFNRNDRNAVSAEIKRFNAERNPYQFKQTTDKSGAVKVTRVVPTNLYDRKLYIESISKSQLSNALKSNNWSKEAAAREFGISARSIGRMIVKHGITAKRYTSASAPASKSTSRTTAKTSKTVKSR